ncbi:hypothetical protein C900_03658 [Fulvivirga imtechensis AK7]|uniref:Uncharacterized protein n=1 Tax=Fulvivirga imtechensis AK7 TaxID=1237149 RepID=L8JSM9_9BACT|nr:hypothetical protein C900_03658 [Fulvivirga imtechensis AK7]
MVSLKPTIDNEKILPGQVPGGSFVLYTQRVVGENTNKRVAKE